MRAFARTCLAALGAVLTGVLMLAMPQVASAQAAVMVAPNMPALLAPELPAGIVPCSQLITPLARVGLKATGLPGYCFNGQVSTFVGTIGGYWDGRVKCVLVPGQLNKGALMSVFNIIWTGNKVDPNSIVLTPKGNGHVSAVFSPSHYQGFTAEVVQGNGAFLICLETTSIPFRNEPEKVQAMAAGVIGLTAN